MQITIEQPELEEAIKAYIRGRGITGDVESIAFMQSRSPSRTTTTIELASLGTSVPSSPTPRAAARSKVVQPISPEVPEEEAKPEAVEAVAEPVAEEAIPFEEETPIAPEQSAAPSKSLFGGG